jgi:hypothetical protein
VTKDEAVSQAQAFVKGKYPLVPPVSMVSRITVRQMGFRERVHIESWMRFGGSTEMRHSVALADVEEFPSREHVLALSGKWQIAFFLSWDTDVVGMPQSLIVIVDDLDGSAAQMLLE